MRMRFGHLVLLALLLAIPADRADARGGGFSSGRSYSSGGHSFGGGSSFGRPSSGRSYSSGSSSFKVPSARPSFPAPTPRPPTFSAPHGKSYSSGSNSRPRPPIWSTSPPPNPAAHGKSYSSGSASSGPRPTRRPNPAGPGFDAAAAAAQQRIESRRAYTQGRTPKPEYRDPRGESRPINPGSKPVEDLRRHVDQERWATREQRQWRWFGPYYGQPVVIYRDPYSSFFWSWLLTRDLETRAQWAYNHRPDMDDARYQEMVRRDAALAERVKKLEEEKAAHDPSYTPPGLDPDLMYTDDYVDAVFNPQPTQADTPRYTPDVTWSPDSPEVFEQGVVFLGRSLLVLAVLSFLVWLVFFKRWGADRPAVAAALSSPPPQPPSRRKKRRR